MYVQYHDPFPTAHGDQFGTLSAARKKMGLGPHRGTDWAPGGLPMPAVATGKVVGVRGWWSDGRLQNGILGLSVVLEHADGMQTSYHHLATIGVQVGQTVLRGQPVGTIGNTGSASNGRHCHATASKVGAGVWACETGVVQDLMAYINSHLAPETYIAPASTGGAFGGDLYTAAESDGKAGPVYYALAQKYSNKHFGTQLTVDGKTGPNTEKAIVRIVAGDVNSKGYGLHTSAVDDGIRGPLYWKLVQKWRNQYLRPQVTVDGKPGPLTYEAEVKIAAWHLNREAGI